VKKAMEKYLKLLVAAVVAFVCAGVGGAYGQQSPDKVWTALSSDELKLYNFRGFVEGAGAYSVLGLNKSALTSAIERAPKEFSQESKAGESRITFPTPRGTFLNFRVELSPISETHLGSSDAWVKTYRGFGIEDLTATTRFEIAVDGLHAMVRSAQGTFFIDPANVGKGVSGSQPYLSYFSNFATDVNKRGREEGSSTPRYRAQRYLKRQIFANLSRCDSGRFLLCRRGV
jgi:hypothetical protein